MAKREIRPWLMDKDGVQVGDEHAIRLIAAGSRFIATNSEATGPTLEGPPATAAVAALISRAAMIGDRIDTDVVSGLEAGMETLPS